MKQMSAQSYHGLPIHMRDQVDKWIDNEGLDKRLICGMEIDEGDNVVRVFRYLEDGQGRRYIDQNTNHPAQAMIIHKFKTPPPEGAFHEVL